MYLTGFADEAADGIDGQIEATLALGWDCIESRNIGGQNIHDISDKAFDTVATKLMASGVRVNCFGSAIANWATSVDIPFDHTLGEAERAIARMRQLGTQLIRIMSFAVFPKRAVDDQMKEERFRRLNILCGMFLDAGIQPVHENCINYGGLSWRHSLDVLEAVPGLKLIFDTGNAGLDLPHSPPMSSWEFYSHVKEHIAYVHIKDLKRDGEKPSYAFPGEGDSDVVAILTDLLSNGYDGGISIEPHMQVVFHDDSVQSKDQARLENYIEYGRRLENIIATIRQTP